jgi:hypothetical protein
VLSSNEATGGTITTGGKGLWTPSGNAKNVSGNTESSSDGKNRELRDIGKVCIGRV